MVGLSHVCTPCCVVTVMVFWACCGEIIHRAASVRKSMGALALVVRFPVEFVSTLLIITYELYTQKKLSSEVTSAAVWDVDTRELMKSISGRPLKADQS